MFILRAIAETVRHLIIVFFAGIAVVALFTGDYQISMSSALVAIMLQLFIIAGNQKR